MEVLKNMKLLINSQPLLVLKELAEQIGLNEAIFLQQLHYWINDSNSAHFIDNKWWIYNTYDDWKEDNFSFWSTKTIKRTVDNLRKMELVITTDKYNNWVQDNTLWYTINYKELKLYEEKSIIIQEDRRKRKEQKKKTRDERKITRRVMEMKKQLLEGNKIKQGQNDQTAKPSKIEQGQNDQIVGTDCPDSHDKLSLAIPEITTEITPQITNNNNKEIFSESIALENVDTIKAKIEKIVGGEVNTAIFLNTVNKNKIKIEDIEFYLKSWNKFAYKTKDDPVAFFLYCVKNKKPIPKKQYGKNTDLKPVQSTNFEQRVYDDEYFENLYDNFRV